MAKKSNKGLAKVIIRALMDKAFRSRLVKNTEAVIKKEKYVLTRQEVTALKKLKMKDWNKMTLKSINRQLEKMSDVICGIKGGSVWVTTGKDA